MKFSEFTYERPSIDGIKTGLTKLLEEFNAAGTSEEAFEVYKQYDGALSRFSTMSTIAFIRNSMDTADVFYDAEKRYFDEAGPQVAEYVQNFSLALVGSPHRPAMEKAFGKLMFLNIEIGLKTFKPEIIPDLQEENRLVTEYDKLIASAQIAFRGGTYTLAQMGPFHEDPDR